MYNFNLINILIMKITKDTRVGVNVKKCSPKERRLVLDYFKSLSGEGLHPAEEVAIAKARWIFLTGNWHWTELPENRHSTSCTHISFKKFLRSVNPYKGLDLYIDCDRDDKAVHKRLKKLGYRKMAWDNDKEWQHIRVHGIGMTYTNAICNTAFTRISKEQFMNLEGITPPKPEPLKFQGYEVEVGAQSIKVGCQKVLLSDLEGFLQVCEIAGNHGRNIITVRDFLRDNKERLGLT